MGVPLIQEKNMNEKNKKRKATVNASITGAQAETIQRFGAAAKEHFVAYSGIDNEFGQEFAKGLKSISQSRVSAEHEYTNIKQQAGFSAEVKTVARENAQKAINGKAKSHATRTDDMVRQSTRCGNPIGGTNEQFYDIAEIDKSGIYIEGTARQLKYVGGTPEECAKKLLNKTYDKYRDARIPIEVPADFAEDVQEELFQQFKKVQNQLENAQRQGNIEKTDKLQKQLDRIQKTQQTLRKGKLTNAEAIEARLHPAWSTTKDIAKISNRAGIQGAGIAAAVGGGICLIQNTVSVIKGDKTPQDAILDTSVSAVKAAATGYANASIGTAVKGAMQNAPSKYLQSLSQTNLPATIVVSAIEIGKTLARYGTGEIDGTQCLTELGEKGTGMLAASAGAAVGQVLIPVPVVGGLIGGMVGYAMSTAYYNSLVTVLNEAKIAHEERLRIEIECQEAVQAMTEYQMQIKIAVHNYLHEYVSVFTNAFAEMELSYSRGDTDGFISGANSITRQLNGKPLFESKEECDALMKRDANIEL